MKKVLTFLIIATLLLSMVGVGAGAGANLELTSDKTSTTVEVVYEVEGSYTIEIPPEIIFNANGEASVSVGHKQTAVPILSHDEHIILTVKSTNNWNLTSTDDYDLSYSVLVAAQGYYNLYRHLYGEGAVNPFSDDGNSKYLLDESMPYNEVLVYSTTSSPVRGMSDLVFTLVDKVQHAAIYKDTLTFTVKTGDHASLMPLLENVIVLYNSYNSHNSP